MDFEKKVKTYILDTSAILSGKPINLDNCQMITTSNITNELKPGGRDYQSFKFLLEKGLLLKNPSKVSINKIFEISRKTGDKERLSSIDIEILALALDINNESKKEPIILTDDYSIQNVANTLKLRFETISQSGITKKFKWTYRCRGCGKKFKDNIKICPICGAETKTVISSKKSIYK
ncbi:nucleic acid-binding protein [Thermoplasmatales archaeon SG8-52-4]|nr:MAG: nucleic acid-binding protein [Thermoplasmatales archaeon SG8-52-4]